MSKNNFINAIKNAPDGEIIIEIDFFLYSYERAVSLITLDGKDYLCLECGKPMYQQYEKERRMARQKYHVYLLDTESGDPVWVHDTKLRKRIIPIFEDNKKNYTREYLTPEERDLDFSY